MNFPFSIVNPETPSFPGLMEISIKKIIIATKGRGIHLLDRAFDDRRYFELYTSEKTKFIIRLRKNRYVADIEGNLIGNVSGLAGKTRNWNWFKKTTAYGEKMIGYNWYKVKIPDCEGRYTLIICYHPGGDKNDKYSYYLTNCEVESLIKAQRVIRWIGRRWVIEEGIRLAKQEVGIEDFMVHKLSAIKKLLTIAYLVVDYILSYGDVSKDIIKWFEKISQRFKKKVNFIYYRISAGLKEVLRDMDLKVFTVGLVAENKKGVNLCT